MPEFVSVDLRDHIATVRLDRAPVNALNNDVLPEPFAPKMTQCSPRRMDQLTLRRIRVVFVA